MLILWDFGQTKFTQNALKTLCEGSMQGLAAKLSGENGSIYWRRLMTNLQTEETMLCLHLSYCLVMNVARSQMFLIFNLHFCFKAFDYASNKYCKFLCSSTQLNWCLLHSTILEYWRCSFDSTFYETLLLNDKF